MTNQTVMRESHNKQRTEDICDIGTDKKRMEAVGAIARQLDHTQSAAMTKYYIKAEKAATEE